jgi:nucleotide-binding universal stress UspA family protein
MFLGSVAQALIRTVPLPVLLVRPSEAPVDLLESVHEQAFTRILIPLDGSALSEEAVVCAVELGTPMDAEYTLLQVIDFPILGYAPGAVGLSDAVFEQWRDEAASYLERIAQDMRGRGLRVRAVLVIAEPAVGILNYVREHAVDLIAMGTHGRSGLAQALLGSVAEQVVRGAGVPVLLRRPQAMIQQPLQDVCQVASD